MLVLAFLLVPVVVAGSHTEGPRPGCTAENCSLLSACCPGCCHQQAEQAECCAQEHHRHHHHGKVDLLVDAGALRSQVSAPAQAVVRVPLSLTPRETVAVPALELGMPQQETAPPAGVSPMRC